VACSLAGVSAGMNPTQDEKATSRPGIKTPTDKSVARVGPSRGTAPRYSTVLGALGRDEVRERVHDRFKARGGDRNRGGASDHDVMAEALTRAEDYLEVEHARWPERETLAVVRRKLEACVT
jgi:hypothetical protein